MPSLRLRACDFCVLVLTTLPKSDPNSILLCRNLLPATSPALPQETTQPEHAQSLVVQAHRRNPFLEEPLVKVENYDEADEAVPPREPLDSPVVTSIPQVPERPHPDRRCSPMPKVRSSSPLRPALRPKSRRPRYQVRKADERRTLLCCNICRHRRIPDVSPNTIVWHRLASVEMLDQGQLN